MFQGLQFLTKSAIQSQPEQAKTPVTRAALREKMIRETEEFLTAALHPTHRPQPASSVAESFEPAEHSMHA